MRTLGDELRKFVTGTRMPNAAQCSGCGYFHLDYPGVREFLQAQDPPKAAEPAGHCTVPVYSPAEADAGREGTAGP